MVGGHMLRGTIALAGALALASCIQPAPDPGPGLPTSGIYRLGKPYQSGGVWQYPAEDFAYDETGIAAVYTPESVGKPTENGEIRMAEELTAAHKTLPLPSLVRVINLENGRSVVVRVNDRGPASHGRIVELSRRGADLLGFGPTATAKVRVQILAEESRLVSAAARQGTPAAILAETDGPAPKAAPRARIEVGGADGPSGARSAGAALAGSPVPAPTTVAGEIVGGRFMPAPVVTQLPVQGRSAIFIQVGTFGTQDSLTRARARLASLGQQAQVVQARIGKHKAQRVRVGPFDAVERADAVLEQIVQAGLTDAKIIVD